VDELRHTDLHNFHFLTEHVVTDGLSKMLFEDFLIAIISGTCNLNVHLSIAENFGRAQRIDDLSEWLSVLLLFDERAEHIATIDSSNRFTAANYLVTLDSCLKVEVEILLHKLLH